MTITNLFRVWIGLLFKLSVVSLCASWPLLGFGNIVTSISTDCISCDGNATVTTTITGSVLYEWYDNQGNILLVDNNASGSSFVSGLCPGVYFVQFTNGFDNDTQWFSINTSTISAGQPVESVICTNTGTVSLSSLITSETPGGQWYAPNGNPIAANLNSNNAVDGFYTYEVTDGSCTVTGGVLIDAVQNANPGLSTTYLICENYSPFQLITVMAGTPDSGGFWEDAAGNPVSGWYDPAIDVTGIFSYHVNTVAICPAAVSTLYVIENQLPDPGIDNTITVCPSGWPFEMIGALSGTPEIGGYWLDNQGDPVSSQFDPLTMNEGNYTYV
ncbi:MAG: hypothetical protein RL226_1796, partial [Bacteroidota bacterium]